jgi:hypothetical protein
MKTSEELRNIINSSLEECKLISEEEWAKKPNPEKWSKQEILGHLIDSAMTNIRRFVISQYVQNQKIVYYQDEWVKFQNYQQADLKELLTSWKLLNLQLARTVDNIPSNKLQNICDTGKETVELHTLEFLITDYVKHLNHHLNQILKK